MARFLLILVSVGVLLNALTFLMVAHYFSQEKETSAQAPARTGPAPDGPANPELLRKLAGLETSIGGLSKKVDNLANRPAPAALATPRANNRTRPQGGRPGAAAAGDEDDQAGGQDSPPPPIKKAAPRPAAPAPVAHDPVEPEKQSPPADGAPPGDGAAGAPAPGADGSGNPSPAGDQPATDGTSPQPQ